MKLLKRCTICKLAGHKWQRIPYPTGADHETGGTFLRCARCDKENKNAGTIARGASGLA